MGPENYLVNPRNEVLDTYLNGTHPRRYGHFYTGNTYKKNVIFARSLRPHITYPLCSIGRALVGAATWTDPVVMRDVYALFNGTEKQQTDMIQKWIKDYVAIWKALVETCTI